MADSLILMTKDGEQPIRIHPGTLENHLRLGWKVYSQIEEIDKAAQAGPVETANMEAGAQVKTLAEKPAKKRK